MILSIKLSNNLNILVLIYIKNKSINIEFAPSILSEYKILPAGNINANTNNVIMMNNRLFLNKLRGLLILYINKIAV